MHLHNAYAFTMTADRSQEYRRTVICRSHRGSGFQRRWWVGRRKSESCTVGVGRFRLKLQRITPSTSSCENPRVHYHSLAMNGINRCAARSAFERCDTSVIRTEVRVVFVVTTPTRTGHGPPSIATSTSGFQQNGKLERNVLN